MGQDRLTGERNRLICPYEDCTFRYTGEEEVAHHVADTHISPASVEYRGEYRTESNSSSIARVNSLLMVWWAGVRLRLERNIDNKILCPCGCDVKMESVDILRLHLEGIGEAEESDSDRCPGLDTLSSYSVGESRGERSGRREGSDISDLGVLSEMEMLRAIVPEATASGREYEVAVNLLRILAWRACLADEGRFRHVEQEEEAGE